MKDETLPAFPPEYSLAMAYVPFQSWGQTYADEEALIAGTLYPELNKPFLCGKGEACD